MKAPKVPTQAAAVGLDVVAATLQGGGDGDKIPTGGPDVVAENKEETTDGAEEEAAPA